LPDAARRAIENDYNGSLFKIIDMRGLANAKTRIDGAAKGEVPQDRTAQRYLRIHLESVGRELGIKTE
jgi:hypothetical protein